jgi:hypothetical protein
MRLFLNFLWGLVLVTAFTLHSCATSKRKLAPPAAPISQALPKPDSVVVSRPASMWDKMLGRTPKPWKVAPITAHQPINIGRKSTVAMYYGTANVTNAGKKAQVATGAGASLLVAAKKSGPIVNADSGAVVQVATSGKGQAAAAGKDITQQQTTTKAGLPWGRIAAGVVGGGFLLWVFFFGGAGVLVALWRKNRTPDNQA